MMSSASAAVLRRRGRNPFDWALSVDSPWNIPLSNSATLLASNGSNQTFNLALSSLFTGINYTANSIAIYYGKLTDPVWDVLSHWGSWSPYFFPADSHIPMHIPAGAVPTAGEATMVIMDPDGVSWHEMWLVDSIVDSTSLRCGFYHHNDGRFNGLATGTDDSQAVGPRAYHGSLIGGLIRPYDISQGVIRHALAMAADGSQLKVTGGTEAHCTGFVWPAFGQDNTSCSTDPYFGQNPIGTLAAIPPSVNVETDLGITTEAGKMIARAAQNYGVYACVDRTGSVGAGGYHIFYAEWPGVDSAWIAAAQQDFNCDRVRHALQVVTNNTSSTPGGAAFDGTATGRRAPVAPEI